MERVITSRLEVVSQMATLFHRVIGHNMLETRISDVSIVTILPDNLKIIVISTGNESYSIIIKTSATCYSFDIKYNQFFKSVVLPIEPYDLDTMYVTYKGDVHKNFIGEMFNRLGEVPNIFINHEFDAEGAKFMSEVFVPRHHDFSHHGVAPNFSAKEIFYYILFRRVRPRIAGELMFPNDMKNGFTASTTEKKRQREEKKELKKKQQEERLLREKEAREKINIDDYPLYFPPPLPGF